MKIKTLPNGLAFTDDEGRIIESAGAIRAIRRHLHMTARQFGEFAQVSGRTVNGWEQGRPIRIDRVYWIRENLARRLSAIKP